MNNTDVKVTFRLPRFVLLTGIPHGADPKGIAQEEFSHMMKMMWILFSIPEERRISPDFEKMEALVCYQDQEALVSFIEGHESTYDMCSNMVDWDKEGVQKQLQVLLMHL